MVCHIDDDAGECWLKVVVEGSSSAEEFSQARKEFYRNGDELSVHGKIFKVFKYLFDIPEKDIKGIHCQVNLCDPWIHKKMELILSGLGVTCKDNDFYGPNDINFNDIDEFQRSIGNVFDGCHTENNVKKDYGNHLPNADPIFKVEEIRLDKDEIYSTFLDKYFKLLSRTCSMYDINNLDDMKRFSKKMETLSGFQAYIVDIVDIDENVWLYVQRHESDKIERALRKYGCSCEIITALDNSKKLKISSVQDNSEVDAAMDTMIHFYQLYAPKNIIAEDIIIEESKDYELAKKYVNDKKVFGRCSYKICGPKSDLSELKTKFESGKHKKDEKEGKGKPVSQNEVRVKYDFESGLKIFISKGNLVHQRVDAIVNPANSQLMHGGGAAAAIAKAAGFALEGECKEFIKKMKSLPVTEVMHTTAGNLRPNIKYVIHTVGPQLRDKYKDINAVMVKTFLNCFKYANDKLVISSIAVPAISSGIYGVPLGVVGSATFKAVEVFVKERKNKCLKEIHFVNIDETTVEKIYRAFRNLNSGSDVDGKHKRHGEDNIQEIPGDETHEKRNGRMPMDFDDKAASFNAKLKDTETNKVFSSAYRTKKDVDDTKASTSIEPSMKQKEKKDKEEDICAICLDGITHPEKLKCGHAFCKGCLEEYNEKCSPKCPTCGMIYGEVRGNQPPGRMDINRQRYPSLPGYENCGHLEIVYQIRSGVQDESHPNPGRRFNGIRRTAYLPDNQEGREVARMLEKAFDNRLIFTIGRSNTTGHEDAVVWNDIHHKTAMCGDRYAYPDPEYLKRVKEELAVKGIYPGDRGKK